MTYYITLEVRTKKALGTDQQDKLRDAVLKALDDAGGEKNIPYGPDFVTASIGGEEA
jgi:hypothetical protein